MARVIREEWQDKEGNVHYPHTEDIVVFDEDGKSLREVMKKVQFEDYTGAAELPSIDTAMAGIVKGKRWTDLFGNIKAALKGLVAKSKATEGDLGDAFSATKAYAAGDYAIYENVLYKFTAAKAAGAWDASKVQAVTVTGELCELNGKMMSVTSVSVTVPNGTGNMGTISIADHVAAAKVVIPVITNVGSANWQQTVGIQGTLLIVAGPGVIQGHVTTVRLCLFS